MSMYYTTKEKEESSTSLPDVSIEFLSDPEGEDMPPGFYWSYCFPGCLPESEWNGPFSSEFTAETDMREKQDAE